MSRGDDELATDLPPFRLGLIVTLSGFSLVAYVLRTNIAIAAVFMKADLHLTTAQIGLLFSSFLVGYTFFQLPWGILGDRFGARSVLCIAALSWGVTSFVTGLVPGMVFKTGLASFTALLILRFLLGAGEAAGFPVAARAIASSMPRNHHGIGYAVVIAGSAAGSAISAPLVSRLMVSVGWRASFYLTSCLAFLLAAVWSRASGVSSVAAAPQSSLDLHARQPPWHSLLLLPEMWKLSLSYLFESYAVYVFVFWSYLYLVDQRHFAILKGGLFAGLPFLVATFSIILVGSASDRLTAKKGYRQGRRNFAIGLMTASAAFLFVGVGVDNPYVAIAAISLSVASLWSVETIFWSRSIAVGETNAGAAGATMNTAGNIGGIISTVVVPVLLKRFGWSVAFGSSSCALLASALLWIFLDPRRASSFQLGHLAAQDQEARGGQS